MYSTGSSLRQTESDVIPSVSSDNLWVSSPPVRMKTVLTSEDVATNIDSGMHGPNLDQAPWETGFLPIPQELAWVYMDQ